jgi:hypothetical protein
VAGNGTSVRGGFDRHEAGAVGASAAGAMAGAGLAGALSAADHFAEDFLDELLPQSLDWRHLVQRYPRVTVALAAAAGFWVGRKKGGLVLAAVTSYVAAQFGDAIAELSDDESVGPGH